MFFNISLPHIQIRNPFVWSDPSSTVPPTTPPKPPEWMKGVTQTHPLLKSLVEQAKAGSKFNTAYGKVPRIICGKDNVLLFEYGDAQFQYRNSDILENATYLHPAFTVARFSMWNKLQGRETFPIAFRMKELPKAVVAGQLFRIPVETLNDLDYHRDNGVSFNRKILPIAIPYDQQVTVWSANGSVKKPQSFQVPSYKITNAMVYVGSSLKWREHLNWDLDFHGGSDFRLGARLVDKTDNRPYFRFLEKDQTGGKSNVPCVDLRFFRTRSAHDQAMINEFDISEQEDWVYQQRKKIEDKFSENRAKQVGPSSRLPGLPF